MTIKEKKKALYDAATKARAHFQAIERKVRAKVEKEHANLEWWQKGELVEKDPEYIAAVNKLYGICEACSILGIESGE